MQKMLALVLVACLVFPTIGVAQSPGQDAAWNRLQSSSMGTKVRLTLRGGAEIEGRLIAARTDEITLRDNRLRRGTYAPPSGLDLRGELTFPRSDVTALQVRTGLSQAAWVMIGAGTMAAILILSALANCFGCH